LKVLVSTQIVEVDEKNLWDYVSCMLPEQCRAARAWLDWSQDDLAAKANVSLSTVRDFEKGRRVPIANNLAAMKTALELDGIAFVDDDGTCGISYVKRKRR
jgi:ribosome-binding protein aMBF1 (putative translation factor)